MVSSVNTNSSAAAALGLNKETEKKSGLGQQDFLRLMVAQSKNQDPLQPQANGEFLSQLAQFSTNDGITKMQESLQQLSTSLQSNQALQASALVGRKVLVESNNLNLDAEGGASASINSVAGLSNVTATVYSDTGELVRTIPLGQPAAGMFQFTWDGKGEDGQHLAAGKYKINVNGTYQDKEVALKTMTSANVDSVTLGQNGEGLKLNVAGVGPVTLDNVKQITV
jgi:flagellar basal-body rod modification protein FlgD